MNPIPYLNTILGTGIIIVIIFIDYIKRYHTDKLQRLLFLFVLGITFTAIVFDYISINANAAQILRTVSFYAAFIFADHFLYGSARRTGKMSCVILAILAVYTALLLNPIKGFSVVPVFISHLPIVMCIIDIILESTHSKHANLSLVLFFCLFSGLLSIADLVFSTKGLAWFGFTASAVCIYFFIIRRDLKTDTLTGIGNRYSFNEFMENLSEKNRQRIFHKSWTIVIIDMDHFKEINDTYGHIEGDNALRDMAKILKSCIRRSDFAARYGGDEFVLAARAETDTDHLIARLLENLKNYNENSGRPYRLEISYGYDTFTTGGGRTIEEFMTHIDNLMYRRKAMNRRTSDRAGSEGQ